MDTLDSTLARLRELVIPDDPTSFWTLVLTVATFVLAWVAWRGLRSLNLAKRDMLTRSTRDALHCAVNCCVEFARDFIPERGAILDEFSTHKITVFVESANAVVFDRDKVDERVLARAREWARKLPAGLHTKCSSHLNRLEGWAMQFTVGLASHQAAFGPCAPLFCQTVVQMYPILVLARSNPSSGPYPNIVKLFETWYGAKAADEERVKMDALLRELKPLQDKGRRGRLPPALGTDLDP